MQTGYPRKDVKELPGVKQVDQERHSTLKAQYGQNTGEKSLLSMSCKQGES
jgi:hypothetical protein